MKKCQKCAQNCAADTDEAARIQQRIMEREVDEALRQEKLAAWWKKYRFFIFGAVAAVILGTIASEWYGAWRHKTQIAESDRFEQALVLAAQQKTDEALTGLNDLAQHGRTGYRHLAKLQRAGILLNAGRKADGLAELKILTQDTTLPEPLRDAAVVAYVGQIADTGNTAELQEMIAPVVARPQGAFYGEAVVLKTLMSLLSGETESARRTVETALAGQNLSETAREQLNAIQQMIQE